MYDVIFEFICWIIAYLIYKYIYNKFNNSDNTSTYSAFSQSIPEIINNN